jgi:hypothetical protein
MCNYSRFAPEFPILMRVNKLVECWIGWFSGFATQVG